jgi:hypothetical protein
MYAKHLFLILAPIFFMLNNTFAYADDECRDVLVNPLFDLSTYTRDTYVSTAIIANLDSVSEEKKANNASLGAIIYGVPVDLKYSDASRVRAMLSSQYDFRAIQKDTVSLLLMSGQKNIIDAWKSCMTAKYSISTRVEPVEGSDGKQIVLHINYFAELSPGKPTPGPIKIASDIYIDSEKAKVLSGADCTKANYEFEPGSSCSIQFEMDSAWTAMPIVFNLKDGKRRFSKVTYIAPRAQIVGDIKEWHDSVGVYAHRTYTWSDLKCAKSEDGYVFVDNSIKYNITPKGASVENNSCVANHTLDATGQRLCFKVGVMNMPAVADYYCTVDYSASQVKVHWDPPRQ